MADRRLTSEENASALRLVRDIQAALDEAERAQRSATAAYRRAGDTLVELTRILRSWPVQSEPEKQARTEHSIPSELANPPMLITIQEATEMAGIGKSSVWHHLSEGAFIARKIGSRTLIEYASFRAWIEALPVWTGRPNVRPGRG